MTDRRFAASLSALALLALALLAAPPAGAQPAAEPSAATRATLADLAWIAGTWRDAAEGSLSEETWSEPAGDSMIGMWRHVAGGEARVFELLSLSEEESGLVFRLRHFDPELVGWEEKDQPLVLPLESSGPDHWAFAGKDRDGGPLRITYRRRADGLSVLLEKGGPPQEFRFERADVEELEVEVREVQAEGDGR